MQSIKDIPAKTLAPGITGHYTHGENVTFGYVKLDKGSMVPLHHHIHEQVTYILEGRLDMTIDGVDCPMTPGMYHVIPSHVPHSALAVTDCKLIDVFGPVREEYKTTVPVWE
ncbi:MAG TPA: cupin domain-containing protein [Chitinophagaceae bacterium]|nr:cupin domain-containing protein [Chitinophagaceae bacterium]